METIQYIDYTATLNQIVEVLNNQQNTIVKLENNLQIFSILLITAVCMILGMLIVKE